VISAYGASRVKINFQCRFPDGIAIWYLGYRPVRTTGYPSGQHIGALRRTAVAGILYRTLIRLKCSRFQRECVFVVHRRLQASRKYEAPSQAVGNDVLACLVGLALT
jgi:hypothetical protein